MWARNIELALGLWLALSPFIFSHPPGETGLWINDFTCAAIVVSLSVLTYWSPLRRAHLGELAVAVWLMALGWYTTRSGETPASQNHIVVGLLLAMFAIIPSRASLPPRGWRSEARGTGPPS